MPSFRTYGSLPYSIAVVHGGPGAAGEMAPVARELSDTQGILEPIQTAHSLAGQVEELKRILKDNWVIPGILIGYSWGAWLSYILAAENPELVKRLILVSSGPFETAYAESIMETRFSRLDPQEKKEAAALLLQLGDPAAEHDSGILERFGVLCSKSDAFDPLPHTSEVLDCNAEIYAQVWNEGAQLRRSRELLEYGKKIRCPVTAIHGDYDPHPVEGVEKPLSAVLEDFRCIRLEKCGHTPWFEREARQEFYRVVRGCLDSFHW